MDRTNISIMDRNGNVYEGSTNASSDKIFFVGELSITYTPYYIKNKAGGNHGLAKYFPLVADTTNRIIYNTIEIELTIKVPFSKISSSILYPEWVKIPLYAHTDWDIKLYYQLWNPYTSTYEYPLCRLETWNVRAGSRTMGATGEMYNIKLLVVDYTSVW